MVLLDNDGKPIQLPKGSLVVDCIYWNRQLPAWYTRYAQGDARGLITVPSHMILRAGLSLTTCPRCSQCPRGVPRRPSGRPQRHPRHPQDY